MRTVIAIIIASAFSSEGALLCPVNYCLMQISSGCTDSDASCFTCEQYENTPGVCDSESGAGCNCVGSVRYGNYYRAGQTPGPAIWTYPECINGTVQCTNDRLSHVTNGAKVCTCEPAAKASYVRDSVAAVNSTSATGASAYVAPTCIIQMMGVSSPAVALTSLWALGVNEGAVGLFLKNVFGTGILGISDDIVIQSYDTNTFIFTAQFNALSQSAFNIITQMNAWRSDNSQIRTGVTGFFTAAAALLGDLSSLAAADLNFVIHPRNWTAAVQCPIASCLNPVRSGSSSASFTCEAYSAIDSICAYENTGTANCSCTGVVKYGNWDRIYPVGSSTAANATWTAGTNVSGSTQCNNAAFGNVISGAKYCTCTHPEAVAPSRSSSAALDSSAGGAGGAGTSNLLSGYETPVCLTNVMQLTSALDAASMYAAGVNQGLLQVMAQGTLTSSAVLNPPPTIIYGPNFDSSTIKITLVYGDPGGNFSAASAAQTLNQYKQDGTQIASALSTYLATDSSNFATVSSAQPVLHVGYGPIDKPWVTQQCSTTTTTTTLPEPEPAGVFLTTPAGSGTTVAAAVAHIVSSSFTMTVSNAAAITSNSTAKTALQNSIAQQLATLHNQPVSNIAVTVSVSGGRRLILVRELTSGDLLVAYEITTDANGVNAVTNAVNAVNSTQLATIAQTAMTTAGVNVTVHSVSNVATAVSNAVTTSASPGNNNNNNNDDTSSAQQNHALAAAVVAVLGASLLG